MTTAATRQTAAIQIQRRDIDGLVLCGEHGGVPYDLLTAALNVQPARLRGITARWRRAGYVATGQLGPGPAWCWLTPSGRALTGLPFRPGPPSVARVMHVRAILAVRLALQSRPDWQQHRPWWASERRIRLDGPFAGRHLPDGEAWWPSLDDSPNAGQVWAIEIELTPKTAARTAAIMAGLAAAGYARVLYFTAPAARPAVARAAAGFPAAPITIHDLPPAARAPGA